jgi:5-methylcytosine-specific restriction endonuclease McrA
MTRRPCLGVRGRYCPKLIDRGSRCDDCRREMYRRDNALRPAFETRIYSSAEWKKLRAEVMADADGCYHCGATDVELSADHLLSVRTHPELALERSNVVAACRSCQRRRQDR